MALSTLVLVPNVLRISTAEAVTEDEARVSIDIPESWMMQCLHDVRFSLVPIFSKEFPCPAWAVRTTDRLDMANVEWRSMVVSEVAVAEAPMQFVRAKAPCPKVKVSTKSAPDSTRSAPDSTKSAPDSTAQQQAPGQEHQLKVPVLINQKAIKTDEELLVYRAPKRKLEGPPKSVKVAKFMKDKGK